MQLVSFVANVPWTFPPHNVPAITQQHLPPFFPLFRPFTTIIVAAGHSPSSATFMPPGCLPQFLNSQQFFLSAMHFSLSSHIFCHQQKSVYQFKKYKKSIFEKPLDFFKKSAIIVVEITLITLITVIVLLVKGQKLYGKTDFQHF